MERRLCKCGCGQQVKIPSSQFCSGHARKLICNNRDEFYRLYKNECKEIICACGCGQKFTPKRSYRRYIRGHNCRGKTHIELYGIEKANKMKAIARGTIKKAQAGCFSTAEKKERWRRNLRVSCNTPEHLEDISKRSLRNWKDPVFYTKTLSASMKGSHTKPNKPEKLLISIIGKLRLPFKYVGDGSYFIGRKNPDFVSTDDSKKIVEFYGDYWHKDIEADKKREEYFKKEGYKVMVIWGHEIEKSVIEVENRLKDFTNLTVVGTR